MTLCNWTAATMDLDCMIRPLPCENIINYKFDNGLGAKFTIRLLGNGNLEIESNRQLIITPFGGSALEIGAEKP